MVMDFIGVIERKRGSQVRKHADASVRFHHRVTFSTRTPPSFGIPVT